jgi:hypothetical protein
VHSLIQIVHFLGFKWSPSNHTALLGLGASLARRDIDIDHMVAYFPETR